MTHAGARLGASSRPSANAWQIGDLAPEAMAAVRVLLVLALIGGAVIVTSQLMSKAQAPARRLMGV